MKMHKIINEINGEILAIVDTHKLKDTILELASRGYETQVEGVVVLNKIGWAITGTSTIKCWGGGEGEIEMKPAKILQNKKPQLEDIVKVVNDGGFGCEEILSCKYELYELYEDNHCEYIESGRINNIEEIRKAMKGA